MTKQMRCQFSTERRFSQGFGRNNIVRITSEVWQ